MRTARIKADGAGYYHCVSRVIERQFKFGDREKEKFTEMMRRTEDFCGVKVVTHCVMSNHFHILVKVPEREAISDGELVRRLGRLYQPVLVKQIAAELEEARKAAEEKGWEKPYQRMRERYLRRMYDVSEFMSTLKQRFSIWYNQNNGRVGTLWEQRFKSVLVEGTENALLTMATYIDLNPIRAGMVKDPKDYRYSGYGEAVAGVGLAREGLGLVMQSVEQATVWGQVNHLYRRMLYEQGEEVVSENGRIVRRGFKREEVEQVLKAGGRLALPDALRCRVRYFTDGVVLGSQEYVEKVFKRHRKEFGLKRQTGARKMKHAEWSGLCTMRALRKEVVSV